VGVLRSAAMRIRLRSLRRMSAIRLFLALGASIFGGEALVMLFLARLRPLSPWGGALLDATLLLIVLFPVFYTLVLRPLTTDLVQREQAEHALQGIEAQLRATLDSTVDGILAVDGEGNTLHTNPRFTELWRIPKPVVERGDDREMLEFVLDQLVDPAGFLAKVRALYGSDAVDADTLRFKDGRVFERHSVPMFLEGARSGRVWSFRDVSERERAEQALKQTSDRLEQVIRVTDIGIFDHDLVTDVIFWSAPLRHLYGWGADEPVTMSMYHHIIHPEDRRRVLEAMQRVLDPSGDGFFAAEHRIVRHDGAVRWVAKQAQTFFEGKGEAQHAVRTVGAVEDITDRKEAEVAVRNSEEEFRSLFNNAEVGMFRTRLDGSEIVAVNDQFVRIFGRTREELQGSPSVIHWADPQQRIEIVRRLHAEGRVTDFECGMLTKRGEVRQCVTSLRLYPAQGILEGSIADITDRKRAEEERNRLEAQFQHAQKMESVGRLAGGVAHDFNNMLGVILVHAELALMQMDPAQPLYDDLAAIHNAAARSAELTQQLLAFACKQQIVPHVLDLNETVTQSLRMLQRLIGEDISLSWQPGAALWPISMDPSQLDQMLANLCVNARDAIADVGSMTISTSNCVIDAPACLALTHRDATPGEYVRLTVSDSGCGMSSEVLEQIFEPFFTTKAVGEGTGLGLSTVYGALRQNNGFITVVSAPDQGTTFDIYLPRCECRMQVAETSGATALAPSGRETVLLVEDDPAVLRMTTKALEERGYTVLCAGGPGEAIRTADEHAGEIDLLLTDVIMPEMNGRDLVDTLLSTRPRLKYLFMSGFPARGSSGHHTLMEAAHFIAKPFALMTFAAKVREVLDRE
jgi:two-component system cell cycle sensor histidine kinase/response regulator CckA